MDLCEWEPDTLFTIAEWKQEVAANITRLGYWDWVEAQYEFLHEVTETAVA
jgi:hypothetical protein